MFPVNMIYSKGSELNSVLCQKKPQPLYTMFDKEERSTDDARGETIPVFFIVPIYVSSKYDTTVRVQSLIVYFAKKTTTTLYHV